MSLVPTAYPGLKLPPVCAALLIIAFLAACAASQDQSESGTDAMAGCAAPDLHAANFMPRSYEPFLRSEAVAIALREWRAFGQPIEDEPPDARPSRAPEDKPERQAGMWERVGDYWRLGQNPDRREAAWTGKHDEYGREFPASKDYDFAWSAAFVSYVMRSAGADTRFPYAPSHHTFINIARQMSLGTTQGWALMAERPDAYAPKPGDLICFSHTRRPLRFEDVPRRRAFPAHCDIVVANQATVMTVVGGNVDDAVTEKHVPVTEDGRLSNAGAAPLDSRYPWFIVLRVGYEQ
jgi:hypothetical protein